MVDVVVRVQDPADVVDLDPVPRELTPKRHLLRHDPGHPECLHDLGMARAGVDEDRLGVGAEDQVAPCLHARADPHVAGEHEEARLELDVDQIEHLDLVCHWRNPLSLNYLSTLGVATGSVKADANHLEQFVVSFR